VRQTARAAVVVARDDASSASAPLFRVKGLGFRLFRGFRVEVAGLRGIIDSCITQLKAQGPARTCNECNEEEEG